jgi:uncharacterized protein involved in outer membrane biogenesis
VTRRRVLWVAVALVLVVVLAGTALALLTLPELVRRVAIWQLQALTGRPVTIEALELSLATGDFSLRGFRVTDHDGGRLVDFERLQGRFRRGPLLRGHVWL